MNIIFLLLGVAAVVGIAAKFLLTAAKIKPEQLTAKRNDCIEKLSFDVESSVKITVNTLEKLEKDAESIGKAGETLAKQFNTDLKIIRFLNIQKMAFEDYRDRVGLESKRFAFEEIKKIHQKAQTEKARYAHLAEEKYMKTFDRLINNSKNTLIKWVQECANEYEKIKRYIEAVRLLEENRDLCVYAKVMVWHFRFLEKTELAHFDKVGTIKTLKTFLIYVEEAKQNFKREYDQKLSTAEFERWNEEFAKVLTNIDAKIIALS